MKRGSAFRMVLAAGFSAAIMFIVSFHEVHYLFVQHHEHEHCGETHLHGAEEHSHCTVCKFDGLFFTDTVDITAADVATQFNENVFNTPEKVVLTAVYSSNPQRGPPAQA